MAQFTSCLAVLAFSLLPAAPLLRAADNPAPPADAAARLTDTEDKLATALRSNDLLQRENDQLKQTVASQQAELEKLRQPAAAQPGPDLARQLAEAQDKLSTVLRSYSLLEAETDRLKADAAKSATDAQAAAAKLSAAHVAQIASLYEELRQARAQVAALATENANLRTRLSLAGPPPGGNTAAPSRPVRPPAPQP